MQKGMVKLTKQDLVDILQKQLERLDKLSERDSNLNYTNGRQARQADDMLKYTQSMSTIIAALSVLM